MLLGGPVYPVVPLAGAALLAGEISQIPLGTLSLTGLTPSATTASGPLAQIPLATLSLTGIAPSAITEGALSRIRYDVPLHRWEVWVQGVLEHYWPDDSVQLRRVTRETTTASLTTSYDVAFCDTDGGAFTATLPAGVAGHPYRVINCGTSGNILTVAPNGAELLLGVNSPFYLFDGEALDVVYEATEGWY